MKNDITYRVIKDHLGSVRMVVNSQTGEVVQRIDYDALGNITNLQNPDEFTTFIFLVVSMTSIRVWFDLGLGIMILWRAGGALKT